MPFATDRIAEQNNTRLAGRKPQDVARHLSDGIVGQDHAVDALARAVSVARAGLADPSRPLANVLLVGPTGVGKTELARRLAASLRSGPDDLCRIDMNALSQEHYVASFSGAPPGYAGSKEGFSLFERSKIEGDPYTPGIVLFDEIEKAHGVVLRSLLHVLDHGELRLANGQGRIDFRNCFVLMTSNLGSRQLSRLLHGPLGGAERWAAKRSPALGNAGSAINRSATRHLAHRAVRRFFDPEFLNRIDEVVVMNHLSAEVTARIVQMQVQEVRRQAARSGVELSVSPDVEGLLHERGFTLAYGARSLRRAVRHYLATPVAEVLATSPRPASGKRHLLVEVISGEVKVTETAGSVAVAAPHVVAASR